MGPLKNKYINELDFKRGEGLKSEEGREGGVGRKGRGQGQQQPGFTRPRGLARRPRASRLAGLPAAPCLPRAARWPGAHAQPGPPPERPAHPRRGRACVPAGRLTTPRAASRAPRAARAPGACRLAAASPQLLGLRRGAGPREGRGFGAVR